LALHLAIHLRSQIDNSLLGPVQRLAALTDQRHAPLILHDRILKPDLTALNAANDRFNLSERLLE